MKKIFGISVTAFMLVIMVSGGTWAYFSDTETSASNSLGAGTLDLTIDGGSIVITTFNETGLKPGDSGIGSSVLANIGSLDGTLDVGIGNLLNTAGIGGTEFEEGSGDLGANTELAIYLDADQSGDWSASDIGLKYDGSSYTYPATLQYAPVDSYNYVAWYSVKTLTALSEDDIVFDWNIPTATGNDIQGDSVEFDVNFKLTQVDGS